MEYQQGRYTQSLTIEAEKASLPALLTLPPKINGLVIFAHGRGSCRFSPRNQYVAKKLKKNQIATLLFDLLTPEEMAEDAINTTVSFNINLLTQRVLKATEEAEKQIGNPVKLGYFGVSTGATAILKASLQKNISAIVCSSGRPDLIWQELAFIKSPTLFLAGGSDFTHLLAKRSLKKFTCRKKMIMIPGANALFEEKGKLEEMSEQAVKWFLKYLPEKKKKAKLKSLIAQQSKAVF